MKKKFMIILLVATAMFAFAKGEPQTTCPVMGGKINKTQYADVEGVRIYVCCKSCIKVIEADPKTYIDKLKSDGVEPEKTPKKPDAKSGASKKWLKRKPK